MAYQPSWVIKCQSYTCRRTVAELFKPKLGGGNGVHAFCKRISSKVNVLAQLEFELA